MPSSAEAYKQYVAAALQANQRRDAGALYDNLLLAANYARYAAEEEVDSARRQDYLDTCKRIVKILEHWDRDAPPQDEAGGEQKTSRDRVEPDGSEEIERAERWLLPREHTTFANVAGMDDLKRELRERVIDPAVDRELYRKYGVDVGGGVVMYGPPGTGKTLMARALAGELDGAFFVVTASEIKNMYVGQTEKAIRGLYAAASQHARAVIFIDEADSLLRPRTGRQPLNAVTQFLIEVDGIQKRDGVLLTLVATNRPWALDPAIIRPGRLGNLVYVGLPDFAARRAMLDIHAQLTDKVNGESIPRLDSFAQDVNLDELARQLEGYTGAEIRAVCQIVKMAALRRERELKQDQRLTHADFEAALAEIKPAVTEATLAEYETFRSSRR